MKLDRKRLSAQRRAMDVGLRTGVERAESPRGGWLKAVREALGMTTRQLAARLGTGAPNVVRLEQREPGGRVTIESLAKAARAMNCRLVYRIVPAEGHPDFEHVVESQALALARKLASDVQHSMRLEGQAVSAEETDAQVKALGEELKQRLDPRIWSLEP